MGDEVDRVARCAGAEEDRAERTRALFEETWKVPVDTYITDGFPLLMTKLSMIPGKDEAAEKDRD